MSSDHEIATWITINHLLTVTSHKYDLNWTFDSVQNMNHKDSLHQVSNDSMHQGSVTVPMFSQLIEIIHELNNESVVNTKILMTCFGN